jgi:tetratricopeptide (TPR) repeat protein
VGLHEREIMANDKKATENWEQILYSPERIQKFVNGEINMQQLAAFNGPEMLQMAVIGFRMYEQGRYAEAKSVFQGLVSLDPKEAYYLTALGAVFLAEDDLDNAKRLFDEAIKYNDKEIASFVNRGEVFLRQGLIMEAAQDFMRAVELDPQAKDPLTQRAKLLAAAALESIEGAQKSAKQDKPKSSAKPASTPKSKK